MVCKYFFPVYGLSSHFLNGDFWSTSFLFCGNHLTIFSPFVHLITHLNTVPNPKLWGFFAEFSSRILAVNIYVSVIHFEYLCMLWGKDLSLFFGIWMLNCLAQCVKIPSFPLLNHLTILSADHLTVNVHFCLFHWFVYLSFCHCNTVLITVTLKILKFGTVHHPTSLFFFRIVLAISGPLWFHMNFRIILSIS